MSLVRIAGSFLLLGSLVACGAGEGTAPAHPVATTAPTSTVPPVSAKSPTPSVQPAATAAPDATVQAAVDKGFRMLGNVWALSPAEETIRLSILSRVPNITHWKMTLVHAA